MSHEHNHGEHGEHGEAVGCVERGEAAGHAHEHGAVHPHGAARSHAHDYAPTFAIVTCSDTRCMKQDTAGAALEALIQEQGWKCASHVVVKDERELIGQAIVHAADELGVDVVLTCGGSGLSPRDVTPEATMDVCDRNVPGIAEAMRCHSLRITPHAMLSRALCMQRGRCLVVNLPGSEKAARENWEAIVGVLPHAVKMMAGGGH